MITKNIKYFFGNEGKNGFNDCFDSLISYLEQKKITQENILFITIFIQSGKKDFENKRNEIENILLEYKLSLPYLIVAQNPFLHEIAIEVQFAEADFETIKCNSKLKIIKTDYSKELFASASINSENTTTEKLFHAIGLILKENDFEINDIIRQWNYIEGIFIINDGIQNYQSFNNHRSNFYDKGIWYNGYPAATGIGVVSGGVSICVHAMKPLKNIIVLPLRNPLQKDAHNYSEQVLVGSGQMIKTTPKFERGKIVIYNKKMNVFVSGTAAIVGEQANKDLDAVRQTQVTINNIDRLVDLKNIRNSFPMIQDFQNVTFNNIRVYIKSTSDFEEVKRICDAHFKNIPIIYLQADICREELLVEIEANCLNLKI